MAFDAPEYYNRYAYREAHEGKKRVLLFENFERTNLTLNTGIAGAGSIARSFERAHSGEASCKVTVGAVDGNASILYLSPSSPQTGVVFIDLYFILSIGTQYANFNTWLQLGDGSYNFTAGLKYTTKNDRWEYWTSGGAWAVIPNASQKIRIDTLTWHHLLMLIDFNDEIYRYFEADGMLIDLTAYKIERAAAGLGETYVDLSLEFENDGGGVNYVAYLDEILVSEA